MGTIACSVILDRASRKLFDETKVRWMAPELLDDLNGGLSWLVLNKPDAFTVIGNIELAEGALQSVPESGSLLLAVLENTGADGLVIGKAIRQIERNELDHNNPDWLTATGPAVLHYTFDKRAPRIFYIFPRPAGPWNVRAMWAATPRVDNPDDLLPVDDIFETTLVYFVIGSALLKNSKSGDPAKAGSYLTMAANTIGARFQAQAAFSPVDPDVAAKTGQDT